MKKSFLFLPLAFLFFVSCNNNKTTTTDTTDTKDQVDTSGYTAQVQKNEDMKAAIEAMSGNLTRKEILMKESGANESMRQKWMKMDVYSDSTGTIRRIKLYPHKGISNRSEEFYYDNGQLFFIFISDNGVDTENKDEGTPGKEFHFVGGKLIRYADNSGDKEVDPAEEKQMYALELPMESEELLQLVKNK